MIDALYNYGRAIFTPLCSLMSLTSSVSHLKIHLTATAEMRATYKIGFKDGATMMKEIQNQYHIT